jgi:hypothetical protein
MGGVEYVVVNLRVVVGGDQIVTLESGTDLSDENTRRASAISAGLEPQGTPLPPPTTPCRPWQPFQCHFLWLRAGVAVQCGDQFRPEAGVVPEPRAFVGGFPPAPFGRPIAPGSARAHDPDDVAQPRVMVVAGPPHWPPAGWQQRPNQLPFPVGQLCACGAGRCDRLDHRWTGSVPRAVCCVAARGDPALVISGFALPFALTLAIARDRSSYGA